MARSVQGHSIVCIDYISIMDNIFRRLTAIYTKREACTCAARHTCFDFETWQNINVLLMRLSVLTQNLSQSSSIVLLATHQLMNSYGL